MAERPVLLAHARAAVSAARKANDLRVPGQQIEILPEVDLVQLLAL